MELSKFREKIKTLAKQVYAERSKTDDSALAYDELVKFPELKRVIVDLLTADFDKFLESVDWVAPRPSTFRINLLNGQSFLIIYTERSWIAQVEGKKYYLLNLDEEERAAESISRILQYGTDVNKDEFEKDVVDEPKKKSKKSSNSPSSELETPFPNEEIPSSNEETQNPEDEFK